MASSRTKNGGNSADCDVVVAGAGPAGVLTAVGLARLGRNVVLLTGGRRRPRIEGLSKRVVDVLQRNGLDNAAAAIGPAVPREAVWNGEAGARNVEHVTSRGALDAALLRDAEAAGVRIEGVRRLTAQVRKAGIEVECVSQDDTPFRVGARLFIEARGRAAPCPKLRQRRGPETTALTRRIIAGGAEACTAVESFADGWAWYVADGEDAFLQIFLDSSDGLPKRPELAGLFDRAATGLPLIQELIGGGQASGAVATRNATPYMAKDLLTDAALRVGDAALAVDPLSGHGVFEALGSALAATAVANTLLVRPERADLARRFYKERAETVFLRSCRIGRDFYALETRWRNRAFWKARAGWPDQKPAHPSEGLDQAAVLPRPVVEAGLVVERRVVVTPDQPRGIWRIDEVPLAELLDALRDREGHRLADCAAETAGRLAVTEPQLATALDWLRSRRLLAPGDEIRLRAEAIPQD
ncbi:MAG: FAD-dependent monooxygenase [Alphaproteobacteria bacterium]|nr:FAD-dependent monooxygenase [Alphaproteobacteria bacterium]